MSDRCAACSDVLRHEDCVKCTLNSCKLHYECSGISEKSWRTMGQQRRDTYKCRICRVGDSGSNASSDGDLSQAKPTATGKSNPPKDSERFDRLFEQLSSMEKNSKKDLDELKESVNFTANKIDDFMTELAAMKTMVAEVEKENSKLAKKNAELENRVSELEIMMEGQQQYERRCNIQLDGVPEANNENVMNLVNTLAVAVDEPIILTSDIQAAHRIPSRNTNRPRPIIIQFTNRQKRDAVVRKAKAKKLKSTNFDSNAPETFVYVNDHLTPYYKSLLFEAKKLKAEKGYKHVWVRNSKIFVRKDDDEPVVRLDSLKDLAKL